MKYALGYGHLNIVKYLIENSKYDLSNFYYISLFFACQGNYTNVVKYFIDQGVDSHNNSNYVLRWAEEKGYLDLVKLIKQKIKERNES